MPSPGAPAAPRLPLEDAYLELLADTLESLSIPPADSFFSATFAPQTHLELRESQCYSFGTKFSRAAVNLPTRSAGRSHQTVLMDASPLPSGPCAVILEYDELKKIH